MAAPRSGGDLPPAPYRTAVCVVRLVAQESGVLYTVVVTPDIRAVERERTRNTASPQEVLRIVQQFLLDFESAS